MGRSEDGGVHGGEQKPRYRVLRVVKDWETGTAYHGEDVIALNGAEMHQRP